MEPRCEPAISCELDYLRAETLVLLGGSEVLGAIEEREERPSGVARRHCPEACPGAHGANPEQLQQEGPLGIPQLDESVAGFGRTCSSSVPERQPARAQCSHLRLQQGLGCSGSRNRPGVGSPSKCPPEVPSGVQELVTCPATHLLLGFPRPDPWQAGQRGACEWCTVRAPACQCL